MKTKVTVGICVRNCEDFIKEAIDSIINQDFPHELMEVIFVDDGSKDKTLSIIKSYAPIMDMQVNVFHQEWKGLGSARNVVVDNAGGDYIVWVDADMMLSRDYVRKLVEFMERNPKVGIAKGKYGLAPGANLISTLEIYSRAASKMVDFNYKVKTCSMGTGGSIYEVKAIKHVGGFNENIKGYGEDWDIEYRIRAAGWLLSTVHVEFRDYERRGVSWKDLWSRYFRRGYDTHHLLNRKRGKIDFYKMLPPAAFLAGLLHSLTIYKLTRRKVVFLMPLQHTFKMVAWCLGYIRGREVYLFRCGA